MARVQFDLNVLPGIILPDLMTVLSGVADCCIQAEGIQSPCCVSVVLTDDLRIRNINQELRNTDSITDVLSFPTINYPVGTTARDVPALLRYEWDDYFNASMLGDIVISVPQAELQAKAYGHSIKREISYLFAHGFYHLLGYDHQTREGITAMRKMEETALGNAGLTRVSDRELLVAAEAVLQNAYAPYSNFRVGASLLCKDGRIFTGCNVENASYGLTNCAERTALFKAVSEGASEFDTIMIAAEKAAPWPCGACRQVLNEFSPDLRVLVSWNGGHLEETRLNELLPHGFGPDSAVPYFIRKEKT